MHLSEHARLPHILVHAQHRDDDGDENGEDESLREEISDCGDHSELVSEDILPSSPPKARIVEPEDFDHASPPLALSRPLEFDSWGSTVGPELVEIPDEVRWGFKTKAKKKKGKAASKEPARGGFDAEPMPD